MDPHWILMETIRCPYCLQEERYKVRSANEMMEILQCVKCEKSFAVRSVIRATVSVSELDFFPRGAE